jgi:hypothetical protein
VISKNDQRRHMTEEQRRATRAKLAAFAAAETEAGAGGDRARTISNPQLRI